MDQAVPAPAVNTRLLSALRTLSMIEGTSTILLFFVAMPLKYFADMPMAVTIVGSLHGLLFVALVGMFVVGLSAIPLPVRLTVLGILASIVPFGPFVLDSSLKRIGQASEERSAVTR